MSSAAKDAMSTLNHGAAIGVRELQWMATMLPEFVIKVAGRWPFKRYPPGVQRRFKRWSRKYQAKIKATEEGFEQ